VYKLFKALYRLKQVSRAWYDRLKTFLLEHRYIMGSVDKTLFTLKTLISYLFRYAWMILFFVALLTLLCPDFRK
jgi:hypothetical protein